MLSLTGYDGITHYVTMHGRLIAKRCGQPRDDKFHPDEVFKPPTCLWCVGDRKGGW